MSKQTILTLVLLVSVVFNPSFSRAEELSYEEITRIKKVINELPEHSVDIYDVGDAKCRKKKIPSEIQMYTWLWKKYVSSTKKRITKTVFGMKLVKQPVGLIKLFTMLTKNKDRDSKQKTFYNPPGCKEFFCAIRGIFGGGKAMRLAYMLARYGYNGSHYVGSVLESPDSFQPILEKELDDIILTLSEMPKGLVPLVKNHALYRYKDLYTPNNGVYANAGITLYTSWSKLSRKGRIAKLYHELAHNMGTELKLDTTKTWHSLSGWVQYEDEEGDTQWIPRKPEKLASSYAATNPVEDFAESVTAYRFAPKDLKKASMMKYYFIRDTVFNGVEFLSDDDCRFPRNNAVLAKILSFEDRFLKPGGTLKRLIKGKILGDCREEIMSHFIRTGFLKMKHSGRVRQCLGASVVAHLAEKKTEYMLYSLKFRKESIESIRRNKSKRLSMEKKTFRRISKLIRKQLISGMIAGFTYHFTKEKYVTDAYKKLQPSVRTFCRKYTKYASQSLKGLDKAYMYRHAEDSDFSYDFDNYFTRTMNKFCVRVFTTRKSISMPIQSEIHDAAVDMFGKF